MSFLNKDLKTMTVEEVKHDLFLEEIDKNKWHNYWVTIKRNWILYAMLIPVIVYFIIFRYMPIYGIMVAFRDSSVGNAADVFSLPFAGVDAFRTIMFGTRAAEFWQAFRNTFTISMYGLLFGFPVPIILALFFSEIKNDLYRSIVQILSYLPKFISTVVITSIITMMFYQGSQDIGRAPGILAGLFANMGLVEQGTAMLRQPQYFRSIYIVSDIWEGAGYGSIVYFAAVMAISPTSYEAAKIDGASKLDQIRHITLPGMAPTLTIMLILRIGSILTVGYEKVLLLYDTSTYATADVISTFVSRVGGILSGGGTPNPSVAAAADLFNSLIAMFLVLGSNFISRRVSSTSLF